MYLDFLLMEKNKEGLEFIIVFLKPENGIFENGNFLNIGINYDF